MSLNGSSTYVVHDAQSGISILILSLTIEQNTEMITHKMRYLSNSISGYSTIDKNKIAQIIPISAESNIKFKKTFPA